MSYLATPRRLLNGTFWMDAAERALGAAAASALATFGAGGLGLLDADWALAGSLAGMAAVLSLLKAIVAGSGGDPETAGFLTNTHR
ncbi:holin [Nonomuraea polychroma]|uniref:holin n=1 Tax=Nonomuraea polychroma TaxID=46176 RepID=UPI003D8CA525